MVLFKYYSVVRDAHDGLPLYSTKDTDFERYNAREAKSQAKSLAKQIKRGTHVCEAPNGFYITIMKKTPKGDLQMRQTY